MAYKAVKMGGTMVKAGCETGGDMVPSMASRGKMGAKRALSGDITTQPHIRTNSARKSYVRGERY